MKMRFVIFLICFVTLFWRNIHAYECNTTCREKFPNCTKYWMNPDASKPSYICQECDDYFLPSLKMLNFNIGDTSDNLPVTAQSDVCVGIVPDGSIIFPNCNSIGAKYTKDKAIEKFNCLKCADNFTIDSTKSPADYNSSLSEYALCKIIESSAQKITFGVFFLMTTLFWV